MIEEDDEEDDEKNDQHNLYDLPSIVVPNDVFQRLQRINEPNERSVRSTEDKQTGNKKSLNAQTTKGNHC